VIHPWIRFALLNALLASPAGKGKKVSHRGKLFHRIQKLWAVPVNRTHRRIPGRQHPLSKDLLQHLQYQSGLRIERTLSWKPASLHALSTILAEPFLRYQQPAIQETKSMARGIGSMGAPLEVLNFSNIAAVSREDTSMLIALRHKSRFIEDKNPLGIPQTLEHRAQGKHSPLFPDNIAMHGSNGSEDACRVLKAYLTRSLEAGKRLCQDNHFTELYQVQRLCSVPGTNDRPLGLISQPKLLPMKHTFQGLLGRERMEGVFLIPLDGDLRDLVYSRYALQ
jgi:hypothetical protein